MINFMESVIGVLLLAIFLLLIFLLTEKSYALDKTRIDEQIKLNWEKILQLREKNNVKHQLLAECEKVSNNKIL